VERAGARRFVDCLCRESTYVFGPSGRRSAGATKTHVGYDKPISHASFGSSVDCPPCRVLWSTMSTVENGFPGVLALARGVDPALSMRPDTARTSSS
jgi:hypothetical protein